MAGSAGSWLRKKTVIRGGFAVNYDVFFNNILSNIMAASPNALGTTVLGATTGGRGIPNFTSSSLPATVVANPQATQSTILADLKNPQTYVWNFGIQRELPVNNVSICLRRHIGTWMFVTDQINPDPVARMLTTAVCDKDRPPSYKRR